MASTYVILFLVDIICPIRMAEHMELLGADYCEHAVFHPGVGVTRAVSVLQHVPQFSGKVDSSLKHVGQNVGHQRYLEENYGKRVRVSVFKDNPVRQGIDRAAGAVGGVLGSARGVLGRASQAVGGLITSSQATATFHPEFLMRPTSPQPSPPFPMRPTSPQPR